MKTLILAFLALTLAACVPEGGGSTAPTDTARVVPVTPDQPTDEIQQPDPVTNNPTPVQATYYSLSREQIYSAQWPTKKTTLTGSCMTHLTKNYCWDNGIKTIPAPANGLINMSFDYFYLNNTGSHCDGGCSGTSFMAQPRMMLPAGSGGWTNTIANYLSPTAVQDIFSHGVATNVTCTETNNVLNCGTFSVQLQ